MEMDSTQKLRPHIYKKVGTVLTWPCMAMSAIGSSVKQKSRKRSGSNAKRTKKCCSEVQRKKALRKYEDE